MKHFAIMSLIVGLAASPAIAQDSQTVPDTDDEGFSLMEEGARMFMRGIMREMEPAMDELRETFDEMGPAFAEFAQSVGPAFAEMLNTVDDFRYYVAPEILPNGDIIIRRKPDAPTWEPDPDSDTGEVEL